MAQSPHNSLEIQRLIRLSAASRQCLSNEAAALRHLLDVPARISHAVSSHPAKWLGGSAAVGLVTTLLLRRKPAASLRPRRGLPGTLLAMAFNAGRPIIKSWLLGQVKQFVISQARSKFPPRPQSDNHAAVNHP